MTTFNPFKYIKLANVLKKIISVFYIISIVLLMGCVILTTLTLVLPESYFHLKYVGNTSFTIDNILKFNVDTLHLPENTNFRSVYTTIVGSATLYFFVFISIFKSLKDLLQTVTEKKPFDLKNPRRLVKIAFFLMIGAFLFPGLNMLLTYNIINTLMIEGLSLNYGPDLFLLLTGFLLLILASIFKYGCYLQNEYDETI